jgi:hypothetical protein
MIQPPATVLLQQPFFRELTEIIACGSAALKLKFEFLTFFS